MHSIKTFSPVQIEGDCAGEQADASCEDVQNQEREPHASTSFESQRFLPRPEEAATRHSEQEIAQSMQGAPIPQRC
jgi:hypothetical protein